MSGPRIASLKPAARSARMGGHEQADLMRQWGEMNHGAPAKKKKAEQDIDPTDVNFLAAQGLAAWMNVAALMQEDILDNDDPADAPRLRISGHLVDENDEKQVSKPDHNIALLNTTKALTTATEAEGMSPEMVKALLAAAGTNSGECLSEESVKQFLAARSAPQQVEAENAAPQAVEEAKAPASAHVAEPSEASPSAPAQASARPAEKREKNEQTAKEVSAIASKAAAAVASAAAASAAAAMAAAARRAAERKKHNAAEGYAADDAAKIRKAEEEKSAADEADQSSASKVLHSFSLSAKGPKRTAQKSSVEKQTKSDEGLILLQNLPKGTGEALIMEECGKYGSIANVFTNATSDTAVHRIAIVRYKYIDDAHAAVGRLAKRAALFGSQKVEVRLGTAEDFALADKEHDPAQTGASSSGQQASSDPDQAGDGGNRDRRQDKDGGRGNREPRRYKESAPQEATRRREDQDMAGASRRDRREKSRDRRDGIREPLPSTGGGACSGGTFRDLFNEDLSREKRKQATRSQARGRDRSRSRGRDRSRSRGRGGSRGRGRDESPLRRRNQTRGGRDEPSKGASREEKKPKGTETFRDLFNADKKKGKVIDKRHRASAKDDDYYYSYYSDPDAPEQAKAQKGAAKAQASKPPKAKAKSSGAEAAKQQGANKRPKGEQEPEYSYYTDDEPAAGGSSGALATAQRSARGFTSNEVGPAQRAKLIDEPMGGRQVRVRGCWAEFLLPDNRSYWVNILTGEKTWARPPSYDNAERTGAASTRASRDDSEALLNPGKHSNVFVGFKGSLPTGMNDVTFRQVFDRFGHVINSKLIADKAYGFVKFSSIHEATRCIEILNSEGAFGIRVSCKFANMDSGVY